MAYKPNPFGLTRDETYASKVAAQRPLLATRIHCEIDYEERDPDHSVRGEAEESMCDRFNEALRSGHGFRNSGEE